MAGYGVFEYNKIIPSSYIKNDSYSLKWLKFHSFNAISFLQWLAIFFSFTAARVSYNIKFTNWNVCGILAFFWWNTQNASNKCYSGKQMQNNTLKRVGDFVAISLVAVFSETNVSHLKCLYGSHELYDKRSHLH